MAPGSPQLSMSADKYYRREYDSASGGAAPRSKSRCPSSGAGGGSAPGRGSRSVSCAPAAAGTSAPGAAGGRSEPRGPGRAGGQKSALRFKVKSGQLGRRRCVLFTSRKLSTYCSKYRPQSLLLSWRGTLQCELCIWSAPNSLEEPRRNSHSDSK